MQASGPVKEATVIGPKIAAVERREVRVPVPRHAAPQGAKDYPSAFRRSAPSRGEGRKSDGGPHADQIAGAMNHVCLPVENFARKRGLFDM